MTGLTAYAGLLKVAGFQRGDAVFVSGAAGAVGSLVGQIAKAEGASRVIGSAGSPKRSRGCSNSALTRRSTTTTARCGTAPGGRGAEGIDVYFDNVGGEHLEAALAELNVGGRVALCGAISQYNATAPRRPRGTWPSPSESS